MNIFKKIESSMTERISHTQLKTILVPGWFRVEFIAKTTINFTFFLVLTFFSMFTDDDMQTKSDLKCF